MQTCFDMQFFSQAAWENECIMYYHKLLSTFIVNFHSWVGAVGEIVVMIVLTNRTLRVIFNKFARQNGLWRVLWPGRNQDAAPVRLATNSVLSHY